MVRLACGKGGTHPPSLTAAAACPHCYGIVVLARTGALRIGRERASPLTRDCPTLSSPFPRVGDTPGCEAVAAPPLTGWDSARLRPDRPVWLYVETMLHQGAPRAVRSRAPLRGRSCVCVGFPHAPTPGWRRRGRLPTGSGGSGSRPSRGPAAPRPQEASVTWLILPGFICLFQGLSHASVRLTPAFAVCEVRARLITTAIFSPVKGFIVGSPMVQRSV